MRDSLRIDPRDLLFGPRRYQHVNIGQPITAVVRMPAGDDHQVQLQLQRTELGRPRLARHRVGWVAD
jgi:hypothetical protein